MYFLCICLVLVGNQMHVGVCCKFTKLVRPVYTRALDF
uniref:Uncharacterized protein n=1 Tax=Arundo donax TaxID=35708 RepID=A0A0A9AEP3_ARUDO